MGFFELYEKVEGNINYWARSITINTNYGIDRDDAFQDLLITVFNEWSRKEKVTRYYIQKRLYYENIRILRNYYSSNEAKLNPIYLENLKIANDNCEDVEYDIPVNDDIEKLLDRLENEEVYYKLMYRLEADGANSKKIFELLMEGKTLRDIAEKLNMTKSNVYKRKRKIEKTLELLVNK